MTPRDKGIDFVTERSTTDLLYLREGTCTEAVVPSWLLAKAGPLMAGLE